MAKGKLGSKASDYPKPPKAPKPVTQSRESHSGRSYETVIPRIAERAMKERAKGSQTDNIGGGIEVKIDGKRRAIGLRRPIRNRRPSRHRVVLGHRVATPIRRRFPGGR